MSPTSTGSRAPSQVLFWLRWSWRDLRARWMQVIAIALVIALGTGSYAGLSSVTRWREISSHDAYAALNMHDLRVSLVAPASVPQGALATAVRDVLGSDLATVNERLIGDTQVDASAAGTTVLVPGRIIGVPVGEGARVDDLYPAMGRTLQPSDAGEPTVMLERNFAQHYKLPPSGSITLSGGKTVQYVGQALTPEYFIVTTEEGGLLAEANFAAVFAPLETAQDLLAKPGTVNDLVLTLRPGVSREQARETLAGGLAERLPSVPLTVKTREEDEAYRLNIRDIEGDQQFYDIFALLIFAGAVVAAFNLISRIVEAQRREIGIAMVLGVPPARIAIRPLLVGMEIALLGVVFGVLLGILIGQAMASVVRDFFPLPRWDTSFQFRLFATVGLLGFLLPFIAAAIPVIRAVWVLPIEAIRPAYRSGRGGGLAKLARLIPIPGDTFWQMPVRNILRTPRRTVLTGLGIAAAIAALIAFVGLIDSFVNTIGVGEREIEGDAPARLEVELATIFPLDAPEVQAVQHSESVGESVPALRVDAIAVREDTQVPLRLEVFDLSGALWRPTLRGNGPEGEGDGPGVYLSDLAAKDLGLHAGDEFVLRHPFLGQAGIELRETRLRLLGTHPHPFRFVAYMDYQDADVLGMAGLTNMLQVLPAGDTTRDEVKRDLFGEPGVVSVQGVSEVASALRDLLEQFVVILRIVEFAMIALVLLIAFNSASINVDERAREDATMFAFGVPVGRVLRMAILENFILGMLATLAGFAGGWVLLRILIRTRVAETMPDIQILSYISPGSAVLSLGLGVVAVALAPLLTWRKLRRINVPAALKVME